MAELHNTSPFETGRRLIAWPPGGRKTSFVAKSAIAFASTMSPKARKRGTSPCYGAKIAPRVRCRYSVSSGEAANPDSGRSMPGDRWRLSCLGADHVSVQTRRQAGPVIAREPEPLPDALLAQTMGAISILRAVWSRRCAANSGRCQISPSVQRPAFGR
jgi:hypothetical protein